MAMDDDGRMTSITTFEPANVEAARRSRDLLMAVSRATRDLLNSAHVMDALPTALSLIGEAAGMDRLLVLQELRRDDGVWIHRVFREWTAPEIDAHASLGLTDQRNDDFPDLVARLHSGEAFWLNIDDIRDPGRAIFGRLSIETTTGFPIFVDGVYWGVVAFDDCRFARAYEKELAETLTAVAEVIAAAIQRKLLIENAARDRKREVEMRAAELTRVNASLRRAIAHFFDRGTIDTLLHSLLTEAVALCGANTGAIFIREAASTRLHCRAYLDPKAPSEAWQDMPWVTRFPEISGVDPVGFFAGVLAAGKPQSATLDDLWLADWFPEMAAYHVAKQNTTAWNIPIRSSSEVIGFLGLAYKSFYVPSTLLVETMETLAQQVSLALDVACLADAARQEAVRRELEQATEQRERELGTVNAALSLGIEALSNGEGLDSFLGNVLTTVAAQMEVTMVHLFQYDKLEHTLELRLTYVNGALRLGPCGDELPLWAGPFPADITPAWFHMCQDRRVFTPSMCPIPGDQFAWPGAYPFMERVQASDASHQVLFVGDEPIGSLALTFTNGQVLCSLHQPFLQAVGRQIALAMRIAQLTDEARQVAVAREREQSAVLRAAELARTNEALKQTLDAVGVEIDLDNVLGKVLAAITRQLGSVSSGLWLRERDGDAFTARLVFQDGEVMEFTPPTGSRVRNVWGSGRELRFRTHVDERRPVVYHVQDIRAYDPRAFSHLRRLGVETLLGIPLLLSSTVVGCLTIRFETLRYFTEEELGVTQAMAHQATMAIQLTRLAEQAEEAAVIEERARFARDVHDTLAQGFSGILMQLGAASQVPGDRRADITPHLETMTALARSSLAEARRSVRALRPEAAPEYTLSQKIEQFLENMRKQTNADITLRVTGARSRRPTRVESELGAIVGEALNNAVKHAAAKTVSVSLDYQEGLAVRLSVRDDGVGFDPTLRPTSESFGILGMYERAVTIGASLTIISEKFLGTEVVVQYGEPVR